MEKKKEGKVEWMDDAPGLVFQRFCELAGYDYYESPYGLMDELEQDVEDKQADLEFLRALVEMADEVKCYNGREARNGCSVDE